MNPSTAFARVLVDELVRGGVTDAVLSPGSRSAPVAVALFTDDVTTAPLLPVEGALPVTRPEPDRFPAVAADQDTETRWLARMAAVGAA